MLKKPYSRQDLIVTHVNANRTPDVFLIRRVGPSFVLGGASSMAFFQPTSPRSVMFFYAGVRERYV